MAIEQNVTPFSQWFTGEDKSAPFTIYQSDGATAQNITGWALSWMVKAAKTDDDSDAIIAKTVGDGIAITSGPDGQGTITVEDDDIAEIEGGETYYHELKRTDDGFETVLIYGTFRLSQAVHQ